MINFRPAKSNKSITRYEAFTSKRSNVQDIRLLSIFSVVMIWSDKLSHQNIFESNHDYYQYGLYVGPDLKVKGGIRVAVLSSGTLQFISKYKGVSDGGGLSIHSLVQSGVDAITQFSQVPPPMRISCSDNVVAVTRVSTEQSTEPLPQGTEAVEQQQ